LQHQNSAASFVPSLQQYPSAISSPPTAVLLPDGSLVPRGLSLLGSTTSMPSSTLTKPPGGVVPSLLLPQQHSSSLLYQ
ncbi:unnamed protein product, partial [Amoebophrya sp. A25]